MKKIDKNNDNKITIDEFLEYYLDGELKIKKKLNETVRLMAERIERRHITDQRL